MMKIIKKLRKYYPLYIFLTGLAIYIKSVSPDVTTGDSGELLTASYCLGTGHPPGYPLYFLTAKLFYYFSFIFIKLTSLLLNLKINDFFAFSVNLFSGFLTTLTMTLLYLFFKNIIYFIYKDEQEKNLDNTVTSNHFYNEIALISALILGSINLVWSQSTNSEVYTLNMFILSLNLFILSKFSITKNLKLLKLFSFLYGLNIVAHQSSLIFAPLFFVWILYNKKEIIKNFKLLFQILILFILGLSIYFYMPIRSLSHPSIDWGNTANLKNFIYHILRKQYGQLLRKPATETILQAKRSFVTFLIQLATVFKIIYKNFTLPGSILVIIGIYEFFRKNKKTATFLLVSILFYILVITYITNFKISKLSIYVNEVFYIPVILLFLIYLPFGLIYLISKTSLNTLKFLILFPYLLYIFNFHQNNKSKNYIISEYARNILKTARKNSKIFVMGDNTTFPLCYYYYVEGLRPDLILIEEYGFIFEEIFKYANVSTPVPNEIRKKIRDKIEEFIVNKATNDVYYTYEVQKSLAPEKKVVPFGIIYKLIKNETERKIDNYTFYSYEFKSMDDKNNFQDLMDRDMVSIVYYHLGEYLNSIGETILASKYSLKSKFVSGTEYAKQRIHYNLALDYKNKGEYDKAIKELLAALEIDPKYSKAYSLLGNIYSEIGRPYDAIDAFKKSIENDPQNSKTYNNLGVELYKVGKKIDAFNNFKKAIELEPNNYEAYNNIAVILEDFKKYNEAIQMYKKAISINPDYKDAYYNLGTLYLNANYIDDAFKYLSLAIKVYPEYADAYYNLGILFQKKRDYASATSYFENALKYKPAFPEAYFNIGVCYLWLKDYNKAETNFLKAIKLKNDYYLAYKHLGNTYYYLNDLSKAYKAWEKAYNLNPMDKELENNLNVLKSRGIQ